MGNSTDDKPTTSNNLSYPPSKSLNKMGKNKIQSKYQWLVENIHEGIIISQDGIIKFINSTVEGKIGYLKDEIIGSSITRFIHTDDRKKIDEYHNKRIKGEQFNNICTVRAIKKDGSIIWISINSNKVEWEGKPAVLSFIRVVTESIIAESKLKESERLFRAIFEQSPSGIFVFDNNYIVTQCNSQMAFLMNTSIENIIGSNLQELKHKNVVPHILQTFKDKNVYYEGCYQISSKDSIIWAFLRLSSIKDEHGNLIGGIGIIDDFTERMKAEEALRESEKRLSQIIDFLPDPTFAIDIHGKVIFWNKALEEMTGIKSNEIIGKGDYEYAIPFYGKRRPILIDMVLNDNDDIMKKYVNFDKEEDDTFIVETFSTKLGRYLWGKAKPLYDIEGNIVGAIESIRDITSIKESEKKLISQKECYEALFKNSSDAIVFFNRSHKVIDINARFTELFGYTIDECRGIDVDKLVADEKTYPLAKYITETVFKGRYAETEAIRYTKGNKPIEVRIKSVLVTVDNEVVGGYGIYSDIREQKQYERQLEFLSIHDQLTGLYNRAYYEEKIKILSESSKYPITIISVDMDGLKLVNDTLGHSKGDELLMVCAKILKKSIRSSDILTRIGGDEFAIILPLTGEENGDRILNRIRSNVEKYNDEHPELQLHISMGAATAKDSSTSLIETYKKADNLMYRDKLLRRNSARSQILNTLMAALAERDYITSGHVGRVKNLCIKMGEKLNLSPKQMGDLTLLAEVHDLGKVGIPDKILFKKGPLTDEEWEIMRQHSEKGYRIALSAPDLSGIADLILKHHERWDGKGYPIGLKGKEIPIECRILSIIDAFDAMTSERPYSNKKSKEEAINELKRCTGTQFDPELVKVFLAVV